MAAIQGGGWPLGAARPQKPPRRPAARLEALERERLARQQREGLAPNDDNRRRTFERDIAALNPRGFFAIHRANFVSSGYMRSLSTVLNSRSSSFSVKRAWICEWHGRHIPTTCFTVAR